MMPATVPDGTDGVVPATRPPVAQRFQYHHFTNLRNVPATLDANHRACQIANAEM